MKTGFVFAIGLAIAYVIATVLIFLFADFSWVFESINTTISDISNSGFTVSLGAVLAVSLVFAVIEVVVTSLLFAVLAMLYNAAASVTGGVQVKLAED